MPRRYRSQTLPVVDARVRRPEPTWDDIVAAFEREGDDEPIAWLEDYAMEVLHLLAAEGEPGDVEPELEEDLDEAPASRAA